MKSDYSLNRLTDEERNQFDTEGYLVVPDALSFKETRHIAETIEKLNRDGSLGNESHFGFESRVHKPDFLHLHPVFEELLDHPNVFPKVADILGWNIYLYHSHLSISPGNNEDSSTTALQWHQDSGRSTSDMYEIEIPARLSLKVAFYLSDVSKLNRGPTWFVPGSHLQRSLDIPTNQQPNGAIPATVPAGGAIIFDRRLWHAASPNTSDVTRLALMYGYGYRWIRPKDEMTITGEMIQRSGAIRRQLMGQTSSENNRYSPDSNDVPLRDFMALASN
tara:strand:+ start:3639 stop:4469 length:831 start_codon:yes stop_codon:yes gene_type:complete